MRYFFITCLLMYSIIPHANADDLMCLSLDGPADLEFNLTDADDFFNCVQIVSYSPAEELKITTVSDGMAHEVKVYDEDGNLEDRLQVGIQEFDKAVFTRFSTGTTKLIKLFPVTSGTKELTVRISHFTEVDGTQVLIVSSQLQAIEIGSVPSDPILPPNCLPGEICFDPMSSPIMYTQSSTSCDSTNTPPTQTEMGLESDEGLNQYLKHLQNVGHQSGLMEALRFLYIHYSHPACSGRLNPNTILGGSITPNEEVFNDKKTTSNFQSGIQA